MLNFDGRMLLCMDERNRRPNGSGRAFSPILFPSFVFYLCRLVGLCVSRRCPLFALSPSTLAVLIHNSDFG